MPASDRAQSRCVAFGGGHGLHASLSALRLLVDDLVVDDLTAVVTVADNGGSSGRLRGEFGVLPPGDLRMALAALCGDDEWGDTWARVLQHRFAGDGEMRGHVVGNLLIVGLWELLGDHVDALDWVGRLLGATGPGAADGADPDGHHRRGARPRSRRPRRADQRARPGRGRDHRRRDRLDRAGPADPPAAPEALDGDRGRRLGGARPGLVVHLGDPAPDGARRCARRWSAPTPGSWSCSTSPTRRGRPRASAPADHLAVLAEHAPELQGAHRARRRGDLPGRARRAASTSWRRTAPRLVVDDVAEATARRATTRSSWPRRTRRSSSGSA